MRETVPSLERQLALEWLVKQLLEGSFRRSDFPPADAHYFALDADMHWSQEADAALESGDMDAWMTAMRIGRAVRTCLDDVIKRIES